jgi:hypothetical protein
MKQILESLADMILDLMDSIERSYNVITCKPKPMPSLLAYNVDWFTHCNWREQIVAFKQLDIYYAYKH